MSLRSIYFRSDIPINPRYLLRFSAKFQLFGWGESEWGCLAEEKRDNQKLKDPEKIKKQNFLEYFPEFDKDVTIIKFRDLVTSDNFSMAVS